MHFHESLGANGYVGLAVALFGGCWYSRLVSNHREQQRRAAAQDQGENGNGNGNGNGNATNSASIGTPKTSAFRIVGCTGVLLAIILSVHTDENFAHYARNFSPSDFVAKNFPPIEKTGPTEIGVELGLETIADAVDKPRNVVLFGPHDRYNFGDLLFTKTLVRLLQHRAGYKREQILMGGLISTDMTPYGGEGDIQSMKILQSLSREDTTRGPYDIVFTGGESTGCSGKCGPNMLPPEFVDLATAERLYECSYLIPKDLFVPLPQPNTDENKDENSDSDSDSDTAVVAQNRAVVNSVGGNPKPVCKKAIDAADHVTYRDHSPLVPDSAVMIRELYHDTIDAYASEVLKELVSVAAAAAKADPKSSNSKSNTEPFRYIAVHRKKKDCDHACRSDLATHLDVVARESGALVVFFAAGTAQGHDSFDMYREISSMMKEPSIVYEGEHCWKVVALISRAEAVLSTSLHVRIMAFIFWRPRATWCKAGQKHSKFIEIWDQDGTLCVTDVSETWSVLSDRYSHRPADDTTITTTPMTRTLGTFADATIDKTKSHYYDMVRAYTENFDKWSSMLAEDLSVVPTEP
eukprot:jgi/Psemu1/283431/fgenesh1_pg.27_\